MKSHSHVRRSFVAGALLNVLLFCPLAHSQNNGDSAEDTSAVQTIEDLKSDLDSIMNEISTPGAAVAIVSADSVIWIGTFGFANICLYFLLLLSVKKNIVNPSEMNLTSLAET